MSGWGRFPETTKGVQQEYQRKKLKMDKSEMKNLLQKKGSVKLSLIGFPKNTLKSLFKNLPLNSYLFALFYYGV